jgi:DNA-binding response OmpR family regulator
VIFSARRKPGKAPPPRDRSPFILIDSTDSVFTEKIAKTLDQWGFRHLQLGAGSDAEPLDGEWDVVLLDIRDLTDEAFGQVYSTRQQYAGVEVILLNRPNNVVASIAGMKAGAVDEIIVPFDTHVLQTIIHEVVARVQVNRAKKAKRPLLTRFSEAMMAATFAQAGDHEGALDILDRPGPSRTGNTSSRKNNSGS